jgi:hypothetical protein
MLSHIIFLLAPNGTSKTDGYLTEEMETMKKWGIVLAKDSLEYQDGSRT